MAAVYDVGDVIRFSNAFTSFTGTATDPTTITFSLKDPAGTITTYTYPATVLKDSTGNFHVDYTVILAGWHQWRWAGTGTIIAASEGEALVQSSHFS